VETEAESGSATPSNSSSTTPASGTTADFKNQISQYESKLTTIKGLLNNNNHSGASSHLAEAETMLKNLASHPSAAGLTGADFTTMTSNLKQLKEAVKAKNTTNAKTALTNLSGNLTSLKQAAAKLK
jgi:hypothetical protein